MSDEFEEPIEFTEEEQREQELESEKEQEIPIPEELDIPPEEITDFMSLSSQWHELFEQYTWNNPIYHKLLLHVFLGQLFSNIKIRKGGVDMDGRVSLLLFQDQGTGKNTAFIGLEKVCKATEDSIAMFANMGNSAVSEIHIKKQMRMNRLDEFSDAATIGTVMRVEEQEEDTDNVKIGDEELKTGSKGKKKSYIKTIIGFFSEMKSDIVAIREAKKILSSDKRDSPILQYINLALESKFGNNVITKVLVNGTVTCKSHASFLLTSYPTRDISIETLSSGLFRRILTYYNPIDTWQKGENIKIGIEKLRKNLSETEKAERHGQSLEESIAEYAATLFFPYIDDDVISIEFNESAKSLIDDFVNKHVEKCSTMPREISALYMSFVSSYTDIALVMASHRALLSGRKEIISDDIAYALDIVNSVLNKLISFIEFIYESRLNYYQNQRLETETVFDNIVINYIKACNAKGENVTWKMLAIKLCEEAKKQDLPIKSTRTVSKYITKMLEENKIEKVKVGSGNIFKVKVYGETSEV